MNVVFRARFTSVCSRRAAKFRHGEAQLVDDVRRRPHVDLHIKALTYDLVPCLPVKNIQHGRLCTTIRASTAESAGGLEGSMERTVQRMVLRQHLHQAVTVGQADRAHLCIVF